MVTVGGVEVGALCRDRTHFQLRPPKPGHGWRAEAGLAAEGGPKMFYGCLPLIAGPLLLLWWLLPHRR